MRAMPTARIASMPFQEKRSPISGMPPLSVLVVVVVPAFVIWKRVVWVVPLSSTEDAIEAL